jgi:ligand-binding sensor domain-containing protein
LPESQVDHLLSTATKSLTAGLQKVRFSWRTGAIFAIFLTMLLPGVITRRATAHTQVLQGYHHTAWTIENGRINSAVWAVQQAPNGFLWLTTPTGVFRFDGLRFEPVDEVTNGQVHNADVISVFLSSSGGVWLTTRTHGLLLWKDNRVTNNLTPAACLRRGPEASPKTATEFFGLQRHLVFSA